jgi:oxygen-independent coproporphyrinogen-3 oxidase
MTSPVKETLSQREPPWRWPRAAYVHVPFCSHHCGYCDFAVVAGRDALIEPYLNALAREFALLGRPEPIATLFLGGGTPTHLNASQLRRLFGEIARWLPPASSVFEFTIEANPATLDDERIAVLAEHGVNRVSLGAQSFHSSMLRVLERDHDAAIICRAVERTGRTIPNVSLDLIFAVPGQTLADWQRDLDAALELPIAHVSTYGLTYEKGTPLWKQRERGEVAAATEDLERAMYLEGQDRLAAAGFEQYEISNFARAGGRCRHNEVYWANEAYFGFGLGAARYIRGCREVNTRDIAAYVRALEASEWPTQQSEELPPPERARETAAVQLRRAAGIHRQSFAVQTGFDLDTLADTAIRRNIERGLLLDDGESVCLTREGKLLADSVCADMLASP